MRTVNELLRWSFERLDRYEARLLLMHVSGLSKTELITKQTATLPPEQEQRFVDAVHQAADGYPIPYILGYHGFWGRDFRVTPDVLIPRPDTETLVEHALECVRGIERPAILELGVGSGCIAVTLALETPGARVVAGDISEGALAVARGNAQTLGADNVSFVHGSWFEPVEGTFDLIVSNPPYIDPNDEHLPALRHEPLGALTDGVDGLSDIRQIVQGARQHLKPNGWLIIEHGYDQGEAVRRLFEEAGFSAVRTVKDLGENDRITLGRL